jgi:hypothetical protein
MLAGKLERLRKTATTPIGFLREGLRTCVDFGLAHPHQYTATFMSPGARLKEEGSYEQSSGSRAFHTLREALRACVDNGDLHTPDLDTTAQVLWVGVHGATALLIASKGFPFVARPALVDHLIDTMIAGLRVAAAAPRPAVQPHSKKWDFFD